MKINKKLNFTIYYIILSFKIKIKNIKKYNFYK